VGVISTIFLKVDRRIAALCICLCIALLASDAEAGMPKIAIFNYSDSLAIEINCSDLFTERRTELLQHGYPLSFVLDVSLFRDDRLWLDSRIAKNSARFRVVYQKWDNKITLELSDFSGSRTFEEFATLDDIVLELEERLFVSFGEISAFEGSNDYYFEIEVLYRNLTFDDVKSADRWLKQGNSVDSADFDGSDGKSVSEEVLGFFWNLAGLKSEKEKSTTEKFRPFQLRRGR
jgi:hypothetical protein